MRLSLRARIGVAVTLMIALVLLGAGATMLWAPPKVNEIVQVKAPEGSVDAAAVTADAALMPDVVGLNESIAVRVLSDSGVASPVSVETVKAPGPAGRVLSQSPEPGVSDPGAVNLEISEAILLPDVVGKSLEDARAELSSLGVQVAATRVVDPTATSGEILSTNPEAGQEAPLNIEVVVADEGERFPLINLPYGQEREWSKENDYIYGPTTFATALLGVPDDGDDTVVEFAVEGRAKVLTFTLGVEEAAPGTKVNVAVGADGEEVESYTAVAGETADARLAVEDVQLLRFTLAPLDVDDPPTVIIGDPDLRGDTTSLRELE